MLWYSTYRTALLDNLLEVYDQFVDTFDDSGGGATYAQQSERISSWMIAD